MRLLFVALCLGCCLSTLDACVTVNKGSGTYTVDPSGCVNRGQK
ncbi:hypothetical protein [Chlamydia sp. 04-14]